MTRIDKLDCDRARETIQQILDGDLMDAALRGALERHLEACESCREYRHEITEVHETLRSAPPLTMSDEAFEAVLDRTTRARPRRGATLVRWGLDWRAAAAALVLGIGIWSLWPAAGYSDAEVKQAALEARLALRLTARALHDTEEAAVQGVLRREISPAIRRLPMQFPTAPEPPASGGLPRGPRT
jgi:anti-sigma factor RsiW